jgi:glycine betaine catabolism B
VQYVMKLLDTVTMYRLVLYGVLWLWGVSVILASLGVLPQPPIAIFLSGIILVITSFAANYVIARIYSIPASHESSIITGLILSLIILPPISPYQYAGLIAAAIIAILSKYLIRWRGEHIFNPAAVGATAVSLVGIGTAGWWIASQALLIPTIIIASLVLIKLRRFLVFFSFFIPASVLLLVNGVSMSTMLVSFPLIFMGSIMLTEPATIPGRKLDQLVFAAIVGLIFGAHMPIAFGIDASPHIALLIGNLFAALIERRSSAVATFIGMKRLSPSTYELAFRPQRPFSYQAGQYIEMTIPGAGLDRRGNRRSFTIASGEKDKELRFGIKIPQQASRFKQKISQLHTGDRVLINHRAGNFLLPQDINTPIIMVAGGVGVTPFIAQLRTIIEKHDTRHIELHHFIASNDEKIYQDVCRDAEKYGVKTVYYVGKDKTLSDDYITQHRASVWCVSGPPPMVRAYVKRLRVRGVKNIKRDYFSGY